MPTTMKTLLKIDEPQLLFNHGQRADDPRDGLTLFGPLDADKVHGIRYGVIGTSQGIQRFKGWLERMQRPVYPGASPAARPVFPGFEAVFGIPWHLTANLVLTVDASDLHNAVVVAEKHQRVYGAVNLFSEQMIASSQREETNIDFWIVVLPDEVYRYCRPLSTVSKEIRVAPASNMTRSEARRLRRSPSLFEEDNEATEPFNFAAQFRTQLKARLLPHKIATQIVRESTIAPTEVLDEGGKPLRDLSAVVSDIAWNLASTAFYKSGGRPWKLADIRPGVCYVGLVFKKDDRGEDERFACCAAQMFLDSGDGIVFKGAVGPWYSPKTRDYHLSTEAAKDLISLSVTEYRRLTGSSPSELFIHGKIRFSEDEWRGFTAAVPSETTLVGVRIRRTAGLRLYRPGKLPVLRGLAHVVNEREGYLWTQGYIPRLKTYPGRGVPKPLHIDVCRGDAPIETVLRDVLALTKLNYNACIYADGEPVTLVFADAVGEILTAGPHDSAPPLPFKYYI